MALPRDRVVPAVGTVGAAVVGSLATDPGSAWFQALSKPSWYPPPASRWARLPARLPR